MSKALELISRNGMMDLQRPSPIYIPFFSRVDLAQLCHTLEYRQIAEIGTARGDYAYSLAHKNPQATIYCIDAWTTYDGYADIREHDQMVHNWQKAKERLNSFKNVELMSDFSHDALDKFGDRSLDFVYIDANHSWEYFAEDILEWSRKVKTGGIVAGHDYSDKPVTNCHVKPLVHAFTEAFQISPWFVIGKAGQVLTWFWVQP
jgi:hypothetical protein